MAQLNTSETYENKRDPQFINQAALEAEHNIVNALIKRDRRRGWREWGLVAVIGLLGFTIYHHEVNEKVYAWRITEGLDGVERADFVEPWTVDAGTIAKESRDWLQLVRTVSSDPVVQDKFHNAARGRMDTKVQTALLNTYIKNHVEMPSKGTRDVLENTFGFTQLSAGEKGVYTFVWHWYEREYFGFVPNNGMEMQATVEMKPRPPSAKEQRQGKLDAMFVSFFDIRPMRQLTLDELDQILAAKQKKLASD